MGIIILRKKRLICTITIWKISSFLLRWGSRFIGCRFPGLGFSNGDDQEPNEAGLKFYEAIFNELRKHDIEPLVTITHFDIPIHLVKEYGGWRSRKLIEFYTRYAKTVLTRYKGLVHYWLTINEINILLHQPFVGGGIVFKEGENKEEIKYQAAHHQLVASALTTKIAHEIDPENKVGCMLAGGSHYPYTCRPEDYQEAIKRDREGYFLLTSKREETIQIMR